MTHRYALLVEYEGSRFFGFQLQDDVPTVQGFLKKTIARFVGHAVTIHAAGRIDTGVHALGQVVHFETPHPIDTYKLQGSLNHFGRMEGVGIHDIKQVDPGFHARFSATSRKYLYVIDNRVTHSPLLAGRVMTVHTPLNIKAMQEAATMLLGHHDFNSFRSLNCQAAHAMRTLDECSITTHKSFIITRLKSRSFLHNQVRIIMGTLMLIGRDKKPVSWIQELLSVKDRTKAGPTAPPDGLYFEGVEYPNPPFETPPTFWW